MPTTVKDSELSKPNKQYRILEHDGSYGFISASRAKHCISSGYAIEVRPRVLRFAAVEPDSSVFPSRPAWGPQLDVVFGVCSDSRQSGFLAYPQPCGTSTGPKFPGLFCEGSGIPDQPLGFRRRAGL